MLKLAHDIKHNREDKVFLLSEAVLLYKAFSQIFCLEGEALALLLHAWIEKIILGNKSLNQTIDLINRKSQKARI